MSQKVRIDGVKHAGASVFLGVDHCNNPLLVAESRTHYGMAV